MHKNKRIKVVKTIILIVIGKLILGVGYIRFSRSTDHMIYQVNGKVYDVFETPFNHEEFYFETEQNIKLHGVLFKPDSLIPLATIIHYPGKGMELMSSQKYYKILLKNGFQVFSFERRGFGKSTGMAHNSVILKKDALKVFDRIISHEAVVNTPIIIWGQSLGGAYATMNAAERNAAIQGLILEGTFTSFPDIGKVYAHALHLENLKWLVPLLMNNDFPAEKEIKKIDKPVLIIHSRQDQQVPYELGKKLYEASNKSTTEFWDIEGKHIRALFDHEKQYVEKFKKLIK